LSAALPAYGNDQASAGLRLSLLLAAGLLAILSCPSLGCAKPRLDRETAAKLIAQSSTFKDLHVDKVTGVSMGDDGRTAEVEFQWTFPTVDDPGAASFSGRSAVSKAHLRLYDDGWRTDEGDLERARSAGRALN
jgi:hypothetical protein